MKILMLISCLFLGSFVIAQNNIGIGTNTPNTNAILDIKSGTKGVLFPSMDSVARKAIPNTKGLLVYDSTYSSYYYNTGAAWQKMSGSSGGVQVVANGTNVGDMLYWNGSAWATTALGKPGQYLQMDNTNKPVWSGDQFPVISTLAATSITDSSATLNMNLANGGVSSPFYDFEKGLCWGTSPNPVFDYKYNRGVVSDTSSVPGNYSFRIGNVDANASFRLLVNTTYYVRAVAVNGSGIVYGNQLTFRTLNGTVHLPQVYTQGFTDSLSRTFVTINYNQVTNNGGALVTARGTVWNTSGMPTTAGSKTIDGSGDGYFNSRLTGLLPNTTYYFRAYATNSAGTAYSDESIFTTNP